MSMSELSAALEVLRNDPRVTRKKYSEADKVHACRTATAIVSSPKMQDNGEAQKILALVLGGLIKMESDSAFQVWSVADECVINLVNELLCKFPDRIMVELFKGIKSFKGRPQRASLEKFSQLCSSISPLNSRKFTLSLLEPLEAIAKQGDNDIKETLGNSMDGICRTLVYFMREKEVQHLLSCFAENLGSAAAVVRRSSALCIVAMCRYYPKMEFDFVTSCLLKQYEELSGASEGLDTSVLSHGLQGIVYCFIQLLRLSVEMGQREVDPRDPMAPHIPSLAPLIRRCLGVDDHNLTTASMELLDATMAYGEWKDVWGEEDLAKDAIFSFLHSLCDVLLDQQLGKPECRMSVKSIALSVLGQLIFHFTNLFLEFVAHELPLSVEVAISALLEYTVSNDPLCKGNSLVFAAYLVSRHILLDDSHRRSAAYEHLIPGQLPHVTQPHFDIRSEQCLLSDRYVHVETLLDVITQGVKDSSTVTSNEACRAIEVVLPYLYTSPYSIHVLSIVSALTSFEHSYWLIRCSVMQLLAKLDFCSIAYVEREFLHNRGSRALPLYRDRQPLQERALNYIIKQLEDDNWKVADSACVALATIVQALHAATPLRGQLPQDNLGKIMLEFENSRQSELREDDRIRRNFTLVVPLLINGLNILLNDSVTKAYYHALYILLKSCWKRDKGTGSWLYELVYPYINEIIPLTLTRISGTAIALDLDSHIEVIKLIWLIMLPTARDLHPDEPSPRMLVPAPLRELWKPVLTHIVRILSISISLGMKPEPIALRDTKEGGQPLGFFASMPVYVELHNALLKQMTAGSTNASLEPTKLDVLTKACLKTLASAIRCAGQAILQYAGEIISYLSIHTDKYPGCVVECIHELFLSCCTDEPDVQVAVTSSSLFPRASSTPAVASLVMAEKMRLAAPPIGGHTSRRCSLQPKFGQPELEMDELSYLLSAADEGKHLPIGCKPKRSYLSVRHRNQASAATKDYAHEVHNSTTGTGLPAVRSTPMVTQVSSPSRLAEVKIRSSKKLVRKKLELLASMVVSKYRATHKLSFQQSTLLMVSQFVRNGVTLTDIDKDRQFLEQVLNQVMGKKSYLPDPPAILPFIFDFVSLVAINSPQLIPLRDIEGLTACVFRSPYWSSSGTLLPALNSLVYTLFSPTVSSPELARDVNELRDHLCGEMVQKLPLPQAVSLLIPFLRFLKNRDQQAHRNYSKAIVDKLLPALGSRHAVALTVPHVENLIELFRQVDRSLVDASELTEAIVSLQQLASGRDPFETVSSPHGSFSSASSNEVQAFASLVENAPPGCVVASRCPWLPSAIVILHLLCEVVKDDPGKVYAANRLGRDSDKALATCMLDLAVTGLSHYRETATMSGAASYWSMLALLFQYGTYLVSLPEEEPETLVDVKSPLSERRSTYRKALDAMAQHSIATGNPPLCLCAFKWLSALKAWDCYVWRSIVLEPTEVYWASLPPWKAHIVNASAFLSFCTALTAASDHGLSMAGLAEKPSFSRRLLQWIHNTAIQNTLQLLCEEKEFRVQLLQWVQLWLNALLEGREETLLSRPLDVQELVRSLRSSNVLILCSLVPFEEPELVLTLAATAMQLPRPYSHRKICRTFLKKAVGTLHGQVLGDAEKVQLEASAWSAQKCRLLSTALASLQSVNVLKGGSELDHRITRLVPVLQELYDSNQDGAACQGQTEGFTVSAVEAAVFDLYKEGVFSNIASLLHLSSTQANSLVESGKCSLAALVDFIVYPAASDMLRVTALKQVLLRWKSLLGSSIPLQERFDVSNSLAVLTNKCPSFSAALDADMSCPECLQYCSETIRQYIDEAGYLVRKDPTQTLASTLQVATHVLLQFSDFSLPAPLEETTEVLVFAKTLFEAYQMCLNFTDVTLHRVVPLHNTALEGREEERAVADMVTTMLVRLVTPESSDFTCVTAGDTRASTSFQYCFGKCTFQAMVNLLAVFTKATIDVYPEVFVEGSDIFLETPLKVLGMTLSDAEILENASNLLVIVGLNNERQCSRVMDLLKTIVQTAAGSEMLKCCAVRMMTVLNNVLYNQCVHQHPSNGSTSPWKSAQLLASPPTRTGIPSDDPSPARNAQSFFDSLEGQTLFELQQHVEAALAAMNGPALSTVSDTSGTHLSYNKSAFYRINTDLCFVNRSAKAFMQFISGPDYCKGAQHFRAEKTASWISKAFLTNLVTETLDLWVEAYSTFDVLAFLREAIAQGMAAVTHLLTVPQLEKVATITTRMCDLDTADEISGLHAPLQAHAKALAILRPMDSTPMLALCAKVRQMLESPDASAHIAGLKAVSYLLLASGLSLETPALFPFLYDYIVAALDKPSNPIYHLEVVHYHVLQLAFTLMNQPAKNSPLQQFTGTALHLLLGLGLSTDQSPLVRSALFRGFNGLLVTFTLSHSHRELIRSFALQTLPSSNFLWATGLVLTCMYTGDKEEEEVPKHSEIVFMDKVERVKIMLAILRNGLSYEAEMVTRVLPRLLIDFFSIDQIMSLLLGEFMRTTSRHRPELMVHVFHESMRLLMAESSTASHRMGMVHWILICLSNILQLQPFSYSVWTLTCIFLSVIPGKRPAALYDEIASNLQEVDDRIFLWAAVEFYDSDLLTDEDQELFVSTFENEKSELLGRMLAVINAASPPPPQVPQPLVNLL